MGGMGWGPPRQSGDVREDCREPTMKYKRELYWATPVFFVDNPDHSRIKQQLLDLSYALRKKKEASNVSPDLKSQVYESGFSTTQFLEHPAAADLRDFLKRGARHCLERELDLYESWCHITNDGGYHDMHEHAQCHWAGIYYVRSEECGFEDKNGTNCFYTPLDTVAKHLHPDVVIPNAREGRLLLFPNYLKHSARPYKGRQDRVIVAFNARYATGPMEPSLEPMLGI